MRGDRVIDALLDFFRISALGALISTEGIAVYIDFPADTAAMLTPIGYAFEIQIIFGGKKPHRLPLLFKKIPYTALFYHKRFSFSTL